MSERATRDYRKRAWGHNVGYKPLDGDRLDAHGWGELADGDYILLAHPDGGETRYRATKVRRPGDPPDMWFAVLEFDPR